MLADEVEFALELRTRRDLARSSQDDLLDVRPQRLRPLAERLAVDRHVAPPDPGNPVLGNGFFEDLARAVPVGQIVARQKYHPDGEVAWLWRAQLLPCQITRHQLVRKLRQHACAVSALTVGRHRATVRVVRQRGQRGLQDVVARDAILLGDKPHAARIAFMAGLIERKVHGCFSVRCSALTLRADRNRKPSGAPVRAAREGYIATVCVNAFPTATLRLEWRVYQA